MNRTGQWTNGILAAFCAALAVANARGDETNATKHARADTVLLAGYNRVTYADDGTYERRREERVRMLTPAGVAAHTNLKSYFTIPYQRGPEDCCFERVEIIKSAGTTQQIDLATHASVIVNPRFVDERVNRTNHLVVTVSVPGLEVGDTLHYVTFDRMVCPRMPGAWADKVMLQDRRPIVRNRLEIRAPRNRPLRSMAIENPIDGTVSAWVETNQTAIVYRWDVADVPAYAGDASDRHWQSKVQRLLVSTCADWRDVSRWYWRLCNPHLVIDDGIRAKARELCEGRETAEARLEALFYFVAREIRYEGKTEAGAATGYEPRDASRTLALGSGVCRDKAALLVALLRAGGFDAYPTLLQVGPRKEEQVPQPYFNHAVVAVREDGGDGFRLLDATPRNATPAMPTWLRGRSYLVATETGQPLRVTPEGE